MQPPSSVDDPNVPSLELPPFDPLEPVRITTHLDSGRSRKQHLNQYLRTDKIGKGKHGDVYMCRDVNGGYQLAVKSVRKKGQRDKINQLRREPREDSTLNSIRKEIAVMKRCRHANLVRLVEVIDDPTQEKIYIIMENLAGGPVEWYTDDYEPLLTLSQTRRIVRDAVLGLEYLHYEGIIHRDIKPANLLYTTDRRSVKIIDFGVAHYVPPARLKTKQPGRAPDRSDTLIDPAMFPNRDLLKVVGTPAFLAPEILWFPDTGPSLSPSPSYDTISPSIAEGSAGAGQSSAKQRPPITKAVDIWALGVTFYCLLFGHTPFQVPPSANDNIHHNEFALYQRICNQDWTVDDYVGADHMPTNGRSPESSNMSESACITRLLEQMLAKEPKSRIPLKGVKENAWILQDIPNSKEWLTVTSLKSSEDHQDTPTNWVKTASKKLMKLIPGGR